MGRKIPPTKKSSSPSNASDVSANNVSAWHAATEKGKNCAKVAKRVVIRH